MEKRVRILMFIGTALMALFFFSAKLSYATPPDNRPPDNRPPDRSPPVGEINVQNANENFSQSEAQAYSQASAEAFNQTTVETTAQGGAGGSGGEGGSVTVNIGGDGEDGTGALVNDTSTNSFEGGDTNFNSESNNTNVVVVPNNNTANCMRVFGISFGSGDGAAGIGYPHRDKSCDFEQAADDAAATGNHKIAWWWRCHKKALYQTFRTSGSSNEQAKLACWNSMMEMLSIPGSDEPVPAGQVIIPEDEYETLMMAQVQQEDLELLEERYAQQQSLIEELKEEVAEHDSEQEEIDRLKREAAKLRAAQEAQEKKREDIQAQFKKRLNEREAKDDKGSEL
jgi:hypothetical protein